MTPVDLRDSRPLGHEFSNLSIAGPTHLGVREVFTLEDLELPIFLNERENEDTIIVDSRAVDGSKHERVLHGGYVL